MFSLPPDEPISSENLNGHAAPGVTSEEVKVDIESPDMVPEEPSVTAEEAEDRAGDFRFALVKGLSWSGAC